MTFQSLFDTGPCNVYLSCFDSTHLLLGSMGKGDSQTHHDYGTGRDYTVSVDMAGAVSVTCSTGAFTGSEVIGVSIAPTAGLSGLALQLQNISFDATAHVGYGFSDWATGGTYVSVTSFSPAAPNPMNLPAASAGTLANGMGMRASAL